MAWSRLAANQIVTGQDLISAVGSSLFTLKSGQTIPNTNGGLTRGQAMALVNIQSLTGNKAVRKQDLVSVAVNTPAPTTFNAVFKSKIATNVEPQVTMNPNITSGGRLNISMNANAYNFSTPATVTNNNVAQTINVNVVQGEKIGDFYIFYTTSSPVVLKYYVSVDINGYEIAQREVKVQDSTSMSVEITDLPWMAIRSTDVITFTLLWDQSSPHTDVRTVWVYDVSGTANASNPTNACLSSFGINGVPQGYKVYCSNNAGYISAGNYRLFTDSFFQTPFALKQAVIGSGPYGPAFITTDSNGLITTFTACTTLGPV